MQFFDTPLPGLKVVELSPRRDARGYFGRLYCSEEFAGAGLVKPIVQVNHSLTGKKGTVRGLHYQVAPHAETKIVRCLQGRIWDVAVDLRPDSPTYLAWHAEELSPDNFRMLVIPEGFAHGYQTLEDDSLLLYLVTASYTPEAERGVCFDDPALGIAWPLAVTEVSERDRGHPRIAPVQP